MQMMEAAVSWDSQWWWPTIGIQFRDSGMRPRLNTKWFNEGFQIGCSFHRRFHEPPPTPPPFHSLSRFLSLFLVTTPSEEEGEVYFDFWVWGCVVLASRLG